MCWGRTCAFRRDTAFDTGMQTLSVCSAVALCCTLLSEPLGSTTLSHTHSCTPPHADNLPTPHQQRFLEPPCIHRPQQHADLLLPCPGWRLVLQEFGKFGRAVVDFALLGVPAAVVNSGLKFMQKNLELSFQQRCGWSAGLGVEPCTAIAAN